MEVVQAYPTDTSAEVAEGILTTTDFVDCYQTHYRRLVRALRLSGADAASAEDIAQEAFARALVHWRRIRRGTNPPGYVYTTSFRLLQRAQRRQSPSPLSADAVPGAPDSQTITSPAPTESAALTALAVEAGLARMPPRRRACAVMCLVVGLPVADAASALGITAGTVRKHLDEARQDLQAVCEPPA
jgi:RNA polymerase sigma-70 factor (ECF subfamily)